MALIIPLILALALPGGAASIAGENLEGDGLGFLTGPAEGEPDDIALAYVEREHDSLSLEAGDVDELYIMSSYASSHNGVTHVSVGQRHQGLDIFGAQATVNIAADGSVIFVGGSMISGIAAAASGTVATDTTDALEGAADGLGLDEGDVSQEDSARLGWQPTDDGALRLAWELVLDETDDADLWNAAVDAETGELLNADNWTHSHSEEELSHLARSEGAQSAAADLGGSSNPVDDGSSYRVYEVPKESPNDGPRTLVTNPADAIASPFGWHDTDGVEGPEFTRTRGNNVHAYTDHNNDGNPDPGSDPDGGASLTFDFPLDLADHPHDYADAAVTNLFYWNNVIHDVLHGYGFDEPSGNFQVNNYGRGGTGGDDVRAEAQDGGGVNNANFSTPAADGSRPRMQMYLWNPGGGVSPNIVTVDEPSSAAGTYGASGAAFGPAPTAEGMAGTFSVVNSSTGEPSQGCGPLVGFPAGAIAIADRGGCPFVQIVGNAQAAGAVAVVVANNVGGNPITMGGSDASITIPSVMVTLDDGATIKAGLPATGKVSSNPDIPPQRDGDLENGIIIHEYGHGISNRLTGGLNVNCLSGQEQMGEGWSDYYAITMLIDPALDDPEAGRGMGPYALFQDDRSGNGIRVTRYSRNMDINPVTYDNIQSGGWRGGSIAQPHGIGWAWASVLWDMNWDLIEAHGFNPDIWGDWDTGGNNLSLQLVTDGLKLQGCGPNFVTGRAAIIAADQALTGGENACLLWSTFARRGLGFSAEGGGTSRNDNTEAFDIPPECGAPGAGFVGPQTDNAPALNTVDAGSTAPIRFNITGHPDNGQLSALKPSHSPSSQRIDCVTLEPFGGQDNPEENITSPTDGPGSTQLTYNAQQDRYQYNWQTSEDWAGSCRQFILTLNDGTQHRANFEFVEAD